MTAASSCAPTSDEHRKEDRARTSERDKTAGDHMHPWHSLKHWKIAYFAKGQYSLHGLVLRTGRLSTIRILFDIKAFLKADIL
jgi:hypothetical protein